MLKKLKSNPKFKDDLAFRTVLRQNYMAVKKNKKNNIRGETMQMWIRHTAFYPCKFADLQLADWDAKEFADL
jgi:hypothetical protein